MYYHKTVTLTLENIPLIAMRTGRSVEELNRMYHAARQKNQDIVVTYRETR